MTSNTSPDLKDITDEEYNRRRALAKLGLAVGIMYITPTVLQIDRSARAQGPSCSPGKSRKGLC